MNPEQTEKGYLLIGTYTENEIGKGSKGIYIYRCDYRHGTFDYQGVAPAKNPSYITLDRRQENLYAVSETAAPSSVCSFPFDCGAGTAGEPQVTPNDGADPCNIVVSPDGRFLVTADYSSGGLSVFPVRDDGSPGAERQSFNFTGSGPVGDRQDGSHIHCARYCRCGRYLFVTDLGADSIYRFDVLAGVEDHIDFDTKKVFRVKAGSGPRHFVFDPDGRYMYLINELSASVMAFSYENGEIQEIQHLTANPDGGDGGDIKLSPDGNYLYASVRETAVNGIAVYQRDAGTGLLEFVYYQPCVLHPRNIEFSPGGRFLFVTGMKEGKVQVFSYDPADGRLTDTGRKIDVPNPTCLVFTE